VDSTKLLRLSFTVLISYVVGIESPETAVGAGLLKLGEHIDRHLPFLCALTTSAFASEDKASLGAVPTSSAST